MTDGRSFLNEIHYFRAFAILNIIAAHTWRIPSHESELHPTFFGLMELTNEVLFHGSTLYFLLVSGFLFHHLSSRKFSIASYYKAKLKNIYSPYLLFTVVLVSIDLFDDNGFGQSIWEISTIFLSSLIQGKAEIQYWYLPFIALVFLVSPILLKIPDDKFGKIAIFMSFIPLLGTRSGIDITIGQYLYFFPVYLLGMYSSMNYAALLATLSRHKAKLIAIALLSSTLLFAIYQPGEQVLLGRINLIESIFYIQKICFGSLALLFLYSIRQREIKTADLIAKYSFSLYFIHNIVSDIIEDGYYAAIDMPPGLLIPASVIYFFLNLSISMIIIMGIKKLLQKHSRYIIGA